MPVREIAATEATTRLAELLDAVERGETVIFTRSGQPVAQLAPFAGGRGTRNVASVITQILKDRQERPRVTADEILAARDEGRKP